MTILPDALRDLEVGSFLSFGLMLFFIGTPLRPTFFYSMTISAGGAQVRFVIIIIFFFDFLFFRTIFLFYYVFFFQIFRIFEIILNYIIDFLGTLNSRASSFGVSSLATNRAMANDFDSFLWNYLSNNFLCSIGTFGGKG